MVLTTNVRIMRQLRMERNIKLQRRRQVERTVVALTSLRPAQLFFIFFSCQWRSVANAGAAWCVSRFEFVASYRADRCSVRPTSQHLSSTAGLCFPWRVIFEVTSMQFLWATRKLCQAVQVWKFPRRVLQAPFEPRGDSELLTKEAICVFHGRPLTLGMRGRWHSSSVAQSTLPRRRPQSKVDGGFRGVWRLRHQGYSGAHTASRRQTHRRYRDDDEDGCQVERVVSFGWVISPLQRRRPAGVSVRISRSWVQTPGASDVWSVHRAP